MHVVYGFGFDGSGMMPLVLRMCPRYWISLVKKWHLLSFIDRCAFPNFLKTYLMWWRSSAEDDDVFQVGTSEGEIF